MRSSSRSAHALLLVAVVGGCMETYPPENNPDGSGGTAGTSAGTSGTTAAAGTSPTAGTGGVAGTAPVAAGAGGVMATGGVPSTGGTLAGTAGAIAGGAAGSAGVGGGAVAGGSGGIGGATGGSVGVAGVGGAAGTVGSAGTAGTAGTAGAAGTAGCSDGCAEVSVPFTIWNAGQSFEIYLNSATDLSAATISVKLRKVAGKAGGVQIFAKNGSAQEYAYAASTWNEVNTLTSAWTTLSVEVAEATEGENPFDATVVSIVAVQIAAGDPWYTDDTMTMEDPTALVNPTVIQIDEIAITGTTTALVPWAFTSSAAPLTANISADGIAADPPYAIEGSTVTWVAP